ncbi:MAG TPA: hypothetical protein VF283_15660 [Bryobacteraceae bacterium]
MVLAGPPKVEKWMHPAFERGRFLERAIGNATFRIAAKKADLNEKIQQWLRLNRLAALCPTGAALSTLSDRTDVTARVCRSLQVRHLN